MISLIICHRNIAQLNAFKASAKQTIKGKYEFVIIDNSKNRYSIFEAYNLGISKAKGNYLAFCHEDILFQTDGWDQLLILHFTNNKKLGLIGVVGGTALPAAPAPWWNKHVTNVHYINVIQNWKSSTKNINKWDTNKALGTNNKIHHSNNPSGNILNNVIAVDGFFMACPKIIFSSISFDEHTFSGFHCYDIDTCLQVINHGYKVAVVHDILIEHTSEGSVNKQWAENSIICAMKWKNKLPIMIGTQKKVSASYNTDSLLTFCYWTKDQFKDKEIRNIIKEFLPKKPFFPKTKNHLFLILWKHLGYSFARYPYKLLKQLIND